MVLNRFSISEILFYHAKPHLDLLQKYFSCVFICLCAFLSSFATEIFCPILVYSIPFSVASLHGLNQVWSLSQLYRLYQFSFLVSFPIQTLFINIVLVKFCRKIDPVFPASIFLKSANRSSSTTTKSCENSEYESNSFNRTVTRCIVLVKEEFYFFI